MKKNDVPGSATYLAHAFPKERGDAVTQMAPQHGKLQITAWLWHLSLWPYPSVCTLQPSRHTALTPQFFLSNPPMFCHYLLCPWRKAVLSHPNFLQSSPLAPCCPLSQGHLTLHQAGSLCWSAAERPVLHWGNAPQWGGGHCHTVSYVMGHLLRERTVPLNPALSCSMPTAPFQVAADPSVSSGKDTLLNIPPLWAHPAHWACLILAPPSVWRRMSSLAMAASSHASAMSQS